MKYNLIFFIRSWKNTCSKLWSVLSAWKFSSWNDIMEVIKKTALQNAFENNIFGRQFFLFCATTFTNVISWQLFETTKTFVNVCHRKNSELFDLFYIFIYFTVHQEAFELGSRYFSFLPLSVMFSERNKTWNRHTNHTIGSVYERPVHLLSRLSVFAIFFFLL